jgi:hypothetical protein
MRATVTKTENGKPNRGRNRKGFFSLPARKAPRHVRAGRDALWSLDSVGKYPRRSIAGRKPPGLLVLDVPQKDTADLDGTPPPAVLRGTVESHWLAATPISDPTILAVLR